MKKAILALLVISALVVMATADKPDHQPGSKSSKEVTSSSEVKKQAKLPTAKRVNIRRKVPSQLQSRLHRFARKLPLHKAFVNSARTARKIAGTAAKRVQKVQKRKRVQKAKPGKQAFKRPVAVNKVNNFGRFLKAFARQFDRPVHSRFASSIVNNNHHRRKFNVPKGKIHPIVFKKAEDIDGYEKFTLDEVIYPEAKSDDEVKERSDDSIEPVFVDKVPEEIKPAKLDVDPRTKKLEDVR